MSWTYFKLKMFENGFLNRFLLNGRLVVISSHGFLFVISVIQIFARSMPLRTLCLLSVPFVCFSLCSYPMFFPIIIFLKHSYIQTYMLTYCQIPTFYCLRCGMNFLCFTHYMEYLFAIIMFRWKNIFNIWTVKSICVSPVKNCHYL